MSKCQHCGGGLVIHMERFPIRVDFHGVILRMEWQLHAGQRVCVDCGWTA